MIKVQIHQKFIPIKETIPSIFHPKFDRMKSINEREKKKKERIAYRIAFIAGNILKRVG